MRFLYSALVASLVAAASGVVVDVSKLRVSDWENVAELISIQEQCRGSIEWSNEGLFRSGSTVRYHGHLWQCTHWNRGENPENSSVWRDLGTCDPDAQHTTQGIFTKRSTSNIQALDDDDEDTFCDGIINWESHGNYRSGTTVRYGDNLYQTDKWITGDQPGKSAKWHTIATCGKSKKVKRDGCNGLRVFDNDAYYRSGTAVRHGKEIYQAKTWCKGVDTSEIDQWTKIGTC